MFFCLESVSCFKSNVNQLTQHSRQIDQLDPLFGLHDKNAHVTSFFCRQAIQLCKVIDHDIARITHNLLDVTFMRLFQIRVNLAIVEVAVQDAVAAHQIFDHCVSHRKRWLNLLFSIVAVRHFVGILSLGIYALGGLRVVLIKNRESFVFPVKVVHLKNYIHFEGEVCVLAKHVNSVNFKLI